MFMRRLRLYIQLEWKNFQTLRKQNTGSYFKEHALCSGASGPLRPSVCSSDTGGYKIHVTFASHKYEIWFVLMATPEESRSLQVRYSV